MTGIGVPFQGVIWFGVENTYGSGISGATSIISDKIYDARIETGEIYKGLLGISEPTVCAYISQPSDPALHLEWVLQPNAIMSLATYCVNRTSTGSLQSLSFFIAANALGSTKSVYKLNGCVAKNLKVSASRGNEYICTADFSVQSVTTASNYNPTTPTAIGTDFARFNRTAHTITLSGMSHPAFFITDSIEITVDNNLKDYWDCDTQNKVAAIPGAKTITGSCDISLDDGGAAHWYDVFTGNVLSSIAVVTGCTGLDDTFTLSNVKFDNTSIDINATGDGMMTSQPFTAKTITIA